MTFEAFDLHPQILAGVHALAYTTPTPIQTQAIPAALQGRDVLGLAQTGTGKTAAFVLPILQRLIKGPRGRMRALIIAPTRELAEQIHESIVALGQKTGLRSATVYGGVSMIPQMRKLRGQSEIIVACPGRLLDHMGQGNVDTKALEVLVLDEADRMFDMGFLPGIRRILQQLPRQRQNMLFSATMPPDIRQLANEILNDPVTVEVDFATPAKTVAHALYPVQPARKTELLMALLHQTDTDSVLVFTRTKHRAKKLSEYLQQSGYNAIALQGNMAQNARQAAMNGFRNGHYKIMVATDIAARGIDVTQISHVINYDIPDTADAYTHRIGRTGRAAKNGDAFTLVTQEDAEIVSDIERVLGQRIERHTLPGFPEFDITYARNSAGRRPPQSATRPQERRGAPNGMPYNSQPASRPSKAPAEGTRQAPVQAGGAWPNRPSGAYAAAARRPRQNQQQRRPA